MHGACHQVCIDSKSLNTKRLRPYSRRKSVAASFRGRDWLFRFWDARWNTVTQRVGCGFGKRIIADSLKKGRLDYGYILVLLFPQLFSRLVCQLRSAVFDMVCDGRSSCTREHGCTPSLLCPELRCAESDLVGADLVEFVEEPAHG